ncbi:MAG TPA: hypothetical protein VE010_20900 [Thermoanaerobaculia bacterium]|nr:hypothetical protein [Thermoanaerobaculia bacterium]
MERRTLGAFVDKARFPSPREFYLHAWNSLVDAPDVLRPKRIGKWEPLIKIESAPVEKILTDDFIVSNGRKYVGMFSRPTFLDHRYYSVTLLLTLAQKDVPLSNTAYEWLTGSFPFTIAYMGSPSQELFRSCLEFHQMLNSGLVEITLESALAKYQHLLHRLDRTA